MEENKKIVVIGIPAGFIALVLLLSILTGSNPIDSLFLMIGQTVLYIVGLVIFGAPVFMLFALVSVTWNEMMQGRAEDKDGKRSLLSFGSKKKKKVSNKKSQNKRNAAPGKSSAQQQAAKQAAAHKAKG